MSDTVISISIHAPVKGATIIKEGTLTQNQISIHAPVKGATIEMVILTLATYNFNPRSREGSDVNTGDVATTEVAFQSTLP